MPNATILTAAQYALAAQGRRPRVNSQGLVTNSLLTRDEWIELDQAVVRMARVRGGAMMRLIEYDLTRTLGGLGTMVSEWHVASERPLADATMDGRSRGNRDRSDKKLYGTPVPIVFSEYTISARELAATRASGSQLDTHEAEEAAQAVAEKCDTMFFSGESNIVVGGSTIPGVTTITGRTTDTAANFGGGDFGTEGNGRKTLVGMISALAAKRYHGPFGVWVANTQYNQLLTRHTDGSGQMELETCQTIPQVAFIDRSDYLSDGVVVMVQMTSNVVDLATAQELTNLEWSSGDGLELMFKVMKAAVHRLKTDYAGNVGIAHATGA